MSSAPLPVDTTAAAAPRDDPAERWSVERLAQSISRIHALAREMDVRMPPPPAEDRGFPGSDAW